MMNASLEEIRCDALRLAPAPRAALADCLVESLEPSSSAEIQRLWIEAAGKRLEEVRVGKVNTIPGEDVLAEARRMVSR